MRHEAIKAWVVALIVVGSWLPGATGSASVFAQGRPEVYVDSYRLGQRSHATPVDAENRIVASLLMLGLDPQPPVDLYVGLIAPDGRFLSFVGRSSCPSASLPAIRRAGMCCTG